MNNQYLEGLLLQHQERITQAQMMGESTYHLTLSLAESRNIVNNKKDDNAHLSEVCGVIAHYLHDSQQVGTVQVVSSHEPNLLYLSWICGIGLAFGAFGTHKLGITPMSVFVAWSFAFLTSCLFSAITEKIYLKITLYINTDLP